MSILRWVITPPKGALHALVGLQAFQPCDLRLLRLDIGLRHIHGGVLRGEIVCVY